MSIAPFADNALLETDSDDRQRHEPRRSAPAQGGEGRTGGDLPDSQLLECFLAGRDELAFEALVCRHGPMVLGVCRRVLAHEQDAEDAFQATFLVLLHKGSSIWPRAKVGNWLYGVAYRIALKARASRIKRQAKEKPTCELPDRPTPVVSSDADWLPVLDRELHGLPAKYRVTIVLCDLQGKTQHDAARQLGWREGRCRGGCRAPRALLGRRLAGRGITLPAAGLGVALSGQAAVPYALTAATVKAANYALLKQAVVAGVISARVAALTEGVLTTMMFSKLKAGFVCVLALAVVATGLGQAFYNASGQTTGVGEAGAADAPKSRKPQCRPPWRRRPPKPNCKRRVISNSTTWFSERRSTTFDHNMGSTSLSLLVRQLREKVSLRPRKMSPFL